MKSQMCNLDLTMQVQCKLYYQLYELHKMDQPIVVATSLILGGVDFVYSAIPNPLQQTAQNGGVSYETVYRLPRPCPWHN